MFKKLEISLIQQIKTVENFNDKTAQEVMPLNKLHKFTWL